MLVEGSARYCRVLSGRAWQLTPRVVCSVPIHGLAPLCRVLEGDPVGDDVAGVVRRQAGARHVDGGALDGLGVLLVLQGGCNT
jgi:hypothetical protein